VGPRHRAASVRRTGLRCGITRLRRSRDKDKLQPLEHISTPKNSHPLPFSTPLFLFLMALGVVQMCATLKGDAKAGGGLGDSCPSTFTG